MKKICSRCNKIVPKKNHICYMDHKAMEAKKDNRVYKKKNIKEVKETHKVLNTYRWQKKREYIKRRDNHHCVRCWIKFGKIVSYDLQVHHIKNRHDYPHLIFDNNNLICLCGECNRYYIGKNELDFE